MFFNIGATISGFILIDGLGELQYQAATADPVLLPSGGSMAGSSLALLKRFGGGGFWGWLIVHWFFSFCFGVISLLVLLCAYVFVQESVVVKVIAWPRDVATGGKAVASLAQSDIHVRIDSSYALAIYRAIESCHGK
ncbi:hypothetical protein MD484_g4939, partial [Candolleomyces efflorescens]